MTSKRSSGRGGMGRKRTSFEWALLLGSLAAILAVVIGLVVGELSGPRGPVDVRVTVTDAGGPASGGRPLEVIVTNVGGKKADEGFKALTQELYRKYVAPSASGK